MSTEFMRRPGIDEQAGQVNFPRFVSSKFDILSGLKGPVQDNVAPGTPAEDILFARFLDIGLELSLDWDEPTSISFGKVRAAFVAEAINRMSWGQQRQIINYSWRDYKRFYCEPDSDTVILNDIEAATLALVTVNSSVIIDPDKRHFDFEPKEKALLTYEEILATYPEGTVFAVQRQGEPLTYEESIDFRKFEKARAFYRRIGESIDASFLYQNDIEALAMLRREFDRHAGQNDYQSSAEPGLSLECLRQVVDYYKEFEKSLGLNAHHNRLDELLFNANFGGTIILE